MKSEALKDKPDWYRVRLTEAGLKQAIAIAQQVNQGHAFPFDKQHVDALLSFNPCEERKVKVSFFERNPHYVRLIDLGLIVSRRGKTSTDRNMALTTAGDIVAEEYRRKQVDVKQPRPVWKQFA